MDEFSDFQMAVQMPNPNVVSMGIPPPLFSNNHGAFPSKQHGKNLSLSGARFPTSPVHSMASHTSKSDLIHSQTASSHPVAASPNSPANKFGASVGSRLANYDLGFSGPLTNGFQTNLEFPLNASSANTPKTINNLSNNYHHHHHHHHQHQQPSLPIPRSNQDLLIGEEDKYSALRLLIETDISTCSSSVFEKSALVDAAGTTTPTQNLTKPTEAVKSKPFQTNGNNVCNGTSNVNSSSACSSALFDLNISNSINSNNSTVVNSNNLMGALDFPSMNASIASEPPTSSAAVGDSSDFGDFQSFTGFAPLSTNPPSSNSNYSVFPPSSNSFMGNFQSQQLPAPLPQLSSFPTSQAPVKFDFFQPVTTAPAPPPLQNGNSESDDGDNEFGDFVSVEPVIPEVQQSTKLPPVPAPAPLPTFSRWNKHLDLAPLTLVKQTPPPLPSALNEDKENIEDIMDIGGYFSKYTSPLENDLSNSPPKSQQQKQSPTQPANDMKDDFDTFSGFKSSTNFQNNIISNSDQDKSNLDCSSPKTNQVNCSPSTMSSSTFIRTSLIRNDKVTDIDPIKWNQTVEESNNELDYSSFERKDFTSSTGGKSKFLDVSPETRSIASLDLGNYVTVDYSDTGIINNNINHNNHNNNNNIYSPAVPSQSNHQQNHNGIIKSGSSGIPGALPFHKGTAPAEEQNIYDEYDKYQCFREECESEQERYYSEWSRCLFACKEIISKAFTVFNGVSTSEVLREVVADDKGYSYVMNILEIYRISLRIRKSAGKLGAQSKLETMSAEITNLWESLSAFLFGTCVSDEISQENVDRDDCCVDDSSFPEDSLPSCGVCLCTVNTAESSQFLDYGGKIYHCKCANFWINEVDAILPSLSYVSNIVATSSSSSSNNNAGSTAVSSFHGNSKNQSKFNRTNSLV